MHQYIMRISVGFLTVFVVLLLFLALKRLTPAMPDVGLDSSWQQALQEASSRNMAYGSGVVFTLGPLSGLYTNQYHPDQFSINTILGALYVIYFVFLAWELSKSPIQNDCYRLLFITVLGFICCIEDVFWYAFTAVGFMVALVDWRYDRPFFDVGFSAILAGLSLTKISLGVGAFVIWVAALLICVKEKRFRLLVWAYPAFFIILWMLCNQTLLELPRFIWLSYAIASGYSEAMGTPVRDTRLLFYFWFSLIAQGFLLHYILRKRKIVPFRNFVITIVYIISGWALFKAGFVRAHDKHVLTAVFGLMVLGVGLWISVWRESFGKPSGLIIFTGIVFMVFLLNTTIKQYRETGVVYFIKSEAESILQSIQSGAVQAFKPDYKRQYDISRNAIRGWITIPPINGTVDVYHVRNCAIFAYDLNWSPRPVFQSYSAYTENLIRINLAHIMSANAPSNIIFEPVQIDGRYPMLDDGLSLLEIYSRYQVITVDERVAVFEKRKNANSYQFKTLKEGLINFGEFLEIPSHENGLIWLSLRFEKTFFGKLMIAVYKAPIVNMEVILSDGSSRNFRVVPSMTSTGFLLSPSISSAKEFAFLHYKNKLPPTLQKNVERIKIEIEQGQPWIYKDVVKLSIDLINFERLDVYSGNLGHD